MLVSKDRPFLMQHADAPDPKWRMIRFVVNIGFKIINFFDSPHLDAANTNLFEKLSHIPGDEGIADSMESVFAEAILLGHFLINWEHMYAWRYGLVKSRIKPCY